MSGWQPVDKPIDVLIRRSRVALLHKLAKMQNSYVALLPRDIFRLIEQVLRECEDIPAGLLLLGTLSAYVADIDNNYMFWSGVDADYKLNLDNLTCSTALESKPELSTMSGASIMELPIVPDERLPAKFLYMASSNVGVVESDGVLYRCNVRGSSFESRGPHKEKILTNDAGDTAGHDSSPPIKYLWGDVIIYEQIHPNHSSSYIHHPGGGVDPKRIHYRSDHTVEADSMIAYGGGVITTESTTYVEYTSLIFMYRDKVRYFIGEVPYDANIIHYYKNMLVVRHRAECSVYRLII